MADKLLPLTFDNSPADVKVGGSIKREDLYGKQTKSVEKSGETLEKVILTPWGETFPQNAFTSQRVDSAGALSSPAKPCTEDGEEIPVHPSSFKETRPLEPATTTDLILLKVASVIPAQTSLPVGLYKTRYNFRDSADVQTAILNVTPTGAFLLVGETAQSPLLGKDETYEFFEDEAPENEENEMGFSMF